MSERHACRIDHAGVPVSDIRRALRFYDAALGALGLRAVDHITHAGETARGSDDPDLAGIGYGETYPLLWVTAFAPVTAPRHIAFRAQGRAQVDAFHVAGLAAGGRDNGAPGLRGTGYPPGYYAAFLLDPDGHNIEALVREL